MPFVPQPRETCVGCGKTVYATEKIVVEDATNVKKTFHKSCLRCATCDKVLALGNYASAENKFLCKPHYKQLFLSKGNYDESFGLEKAKDRFAAAPTPVGLQSTSFVPLAKTEVPKTTEPQQTSEETAAKFRRFREQSDAEKCQSCEKSVYAAERLVVADKKVQKLFHKACFKCSVCNLTLDLRNFGFFDQKVFCNNHLKEVAQKSIPSAPAASGDAKEGAEGESGGEAYKTSDETAAKFRRFREQSDADKCQSCDKTVYFSEKMVVDDRKEKKTFHKSCFKCATCSMMLDLRNFGFFERNVYCKNHLKDVSSKVEAKPGAAAVVAPASFIPTPAAEKMPEKSETPAHVAARFKGVGGATDKCKVCGKTVYATEKLAVDDFKSQSQMVFHKGCLKCSHCNIQLDVSNFGSAEGVIYCQTHLKQLAKPAQAKDNAYFVSPLKQGTDYVPQYDENPSGASEDQRSSNATPEAYRESEARADELSRETGADESDARADETPAEESEKPSEDAAAEESTPAAEDNQASDQPAEEAASEASAQQETEEERSSEDRAAERERRRAEREKQRQEEEAAAEREREERRRRREEERAARAAEAEAEAVA